MDVVLSIKIIFFQENGHFSKNLKDFLTFYLAWINMF